MWKPWDVDGCIWIFYDFILFFSLVFLEEEHGFGKTIAFLWPKHDKT